MSTPLQPVITQAGLAAVFRATNDGLAAQITQVGLGTTGYTPTKTQTALRARKGLYPISDGQRLSDTLIHITSVADGAAEFWVREVGFYLSDGTLFAVWSDPTTALAYKSPNAQLLLAYDLSLEALPANSVTINSTGAGLNLTLSEQLAALTSGAIAAQLRDLKQRDTQAYLVERDRIVGQQLDNLMGRMREAENRHASDHEALLTALVSNCSGLISLQNLFLQNHYGA